MKQISAFLFATACSFSAAFAQAPEWDVNNPPGDSSIVNFTVTEGTWMNLDVSPDGSQLVFDLLGDIYTLPIAGGTATPIHTGRAFEVQPRFSPDGKQISYTSDAGGADNIWVSNADGTDAKQITDEDFRLLNNAVWSPDGQYLVARKHFTSTRSAGAGEMWMYHISGGSGFQLTKKKNDQQDAGEPFFSPDGNSVYFSEDMYPGGYFQYNKDPNSQIYVIRRYNRSDGTVEDVISGPGGAFRPVVSHDGKKLAFVRRVREKTVLYLHDFASGTQTVLYDSLSKDQQEAWALFGVYSNFNFTPDDKYIIIWAFGQIHKIEVATGKSAIIPFRVEITQNITTALQFQNETAPDSFTVKAIRQTLTSPDQKFIVFNAAGYLWKKMMPDGTPFRITDGTDWEYDPYLSDDGKTLLYVSWNDEKMGAIRSLDISSCSASKPCRISKKITSEMGIYRYPVLSPDAKYILYQKEGGNGHLGYAYTQNPGIYRMKSDGTDALRISEEGEQARFDSTGNYIWYQTGGTIFGSIEKAFHRIDLDGNNKQTFFTGKYITQFAPSHNGKWLAFLELYKLYVIPMPPVGKSVDLSSSIKSVPVTCVSADAGISLHWAADNTTLCWTLGDAYYSIDVTSRFTYLQPGVDSLAPLDTTGIYIGLKLASDKPAGSVLLKNARIISMEGEEIIENGDILVTGNRIEAMGQTGTIAVPSNAKTVDCAGKTIIPGFVDVHAHTGNFRLGISPQKQWEYYANLAYGVTTTHDPSTNTEMVFSQSEMIKAGWMTGPRLFSTGTILYGADGDFKAVINSLEDARFTIRRTAAFGAFSVKSYNQPRRNQRQQVLQAAREYKIEVVPEGGSHFFHNISMVLDGHTGVEHNLPVATLYDDVIQLWSRTRVAYTPTLIVSYGSVSGEYYWYQHTNVWENKKLLMFTPRPVIDSRSRHRIMIPEAEYENGHIRVAQSCKRLLDAGVKINMGSHGQIQGIGAHWEIRMFVQGGMTPLEALRCATLNGAAYLGMENDIGSLKAGKLADLIILNANPLEDISHTEQIQYVMMNGRLYDASTLNETVTREKPRTQFYWETFGNDNFPFDAEHCNFQHGGCVCE